MARIAERRKLVRDKPTLTIGTGPLVDPAIKELYDEIMVKYLPYRFPTMFKKNGDIVNNLATGLCYPVDVTDLEPAEMLYHLSQNVEEDFYFMCPDSDGQFRLRGYIACFPGGFLSPARVGESVREIHKPVPGYDQKLGASVDRYFARMEPGQFIGRMNVRNYLMNALLSPADMISTSGLFRSMVKISSVLTGTTSTPDKMALCSTRSLTPPSTNATSVLSIRL